MEQKKRKAALHNLGCKVNAYETEAMGQLLEEHGYELVPFEEKADVYLINTCSVTNMADRKSRQMLHRAKKQNPDAVIVAAGCYVQESAKEILERGDADLVIGNNQKARLPELLKTFFEDPEPEQAVVDLSHASKYELMTLKRTAEHTRAFIKIQDGCNQFCSYCIIPYMRGRIRSRALSDILSEVENLAAQGYKEVVLTGIHLSSYGKDFLEHPPAGLDGTALLEVIRSVAAIPGIARVRLGSLEPRIITEEFAAAISEIPEFCPHFHLSLQSGCDLTLKRMNRHYTTAEYEEACTLLRKYFKHPAITTDVIVGFPAETEEEFQKTLSFLEKIGFYEMHIFKYSVRKGTKAAGMSGQVREEIKTKRSHLALALEKRLSEEFRSFYDGKETEILLEEIHEIEGKPYMVGFTREYVKAAVPIEEKTEEMLKPGMLLSVKLGGVLADGILRAEKTS
ncbi:MAG: tRNA (N(6)-L-threonylcarbamoyladenosine(37)-C(2))-methylthiotransferase MtaB [Lachnospiraceae bacterium]